MCVAIEAMHNSFKAIGLSYKTAPLEVREKVALDQEQCAALTKLLSEYGEVSEALVLSTCNRTEVYYSSTKEQTELILKLLKVTKGIDAAENISKYFWSIESHAESVKHLYDVAIGLEAQVVGDMQIINQVKNAYQISADLEMSGPFMHRLLHSIFYSNKRVVQETTFRDGAASVSYAAVELIEELTAAINTPKVLVLGLGDIGEDVARNLVNMDDKKVYISNRTLDKAEVLAKELDYEVLPFERIGEFAGEVDVIISSVSVQEPIITKPWFVNSELHSHKYLFDLSVPRSIESDIESINGIILYNIDDIEEKATAALDKRLSAIPDVKGIISESIKELDTWAKEMEVSPVINKLKNALEDIRKKEINRYVKSLSSEENELIDTVTKNMMQKIIKLPVLQLKAACKRGEADSLIEVLNDLFNLEQKSDKIEQ